jgi:hypothetical protein
MADFDIHIRTFTVRDFLSWHRAGHLKLNPDFQRRPHWKPAAKSYLLDTILRGYPIPPIFVRERSAASEIEPRRDIVDGQQRLRTLFSFIAPETLLDFDAARDYFVISAKHYAPLAGMSFKDFHVTDKRKLLDYQIATHVLPSGTDDKVVLEIFARMNATGTKLSDQELRNAEYFGEFKNLSYKLAYEQLDRWRSWHIFTVAQIARMQEVEMTSDLLWLIMDGIHGKSQSALDTVYGDNDDGVTHKSELARRFRATMDSIDKVIGDTIAETAFSRQALFYTLFCVVYDVAFGLRTSLSSRASAHRVAPRIGSALVRISDKIRENTVPKAFSDAFEKATADKGRRDRRFTYVMRELRLG